MAKFVSLTGLQKFKEKVSELISNHTLNSTVHVTETERGNWNAAKTNAATAQSRADDAYDLAENHNHEGVYATATHEHSASEITSGTLPLSRGGTGAALSRTNNAIIRFSSSGNYFSKTATANGAFYATAANGSPKFGTLPIAQGGTGATDVETALANLGAAPSDHNHDETYAPKEHEHSQYLTQHQDISGKANVSDLTSHTGNTTVHITATERNTWNKKADDFTLEIYNGTGGNPKPVRFASFNYSSCNSENGIAAKISLVSGHGNGSSYAFLEDAIIRVNYQGGVEVDNFKYYGASTGTYDGAARQYGDIFWLIDSTNKIVDFYCLMGQYARVYQTPWKRLTYSTGGTVTQYTSCTVYSSGTKNWANNSEIATKGDIVAGGGSTGAVSSVNGKTGDVQITASDIGAAEMGHTHDAYLPKTGGTLTGAIVAPVFKSDTTDSAIKASDSNEINFGSNTNVIFFGYENRVGSPVAVDTYKFGTHSGSANVTSGTIECGKVITGAVSTSGGAYISGRYVGGGDDEGLIIGRADNNYAGLTLGGATGVHATLYLMPDNSTVWRHHNGSAASDIKHPQKAGTIALTSDITAAIGDAIGASY